MAVTWGPSSVPLRALRFNDSRPVEDALNSADRTPRKPLQKRGVHATRLLAELHHPPEKVIAMSNYEIVTREDFSDVTFLLEVRHPLMAKAAKPGSS